MQASKRLFFLRLLVLLSAVLLGIGILAPCMTIVPGFGDYGPLVKLLEPEMTRPVTYSIISGIREMIEGGDFWLGIVVLAFSVLFPAWKTLIYWSALGHDEHHAKKGAWADHLGKFSMVDVFVIALLVLAIKGLPGGTHIEIRWGLWLFGASIMLTMIVAVARPGLHAENSGSD